MPFPQHPDIFENGNVRPHVSGVFRHQKRGFSKTVSRVEFLKTSAYRFRLDGRKRRFSNTMISHIIEAMAYKGCHRISIVLVLTCGRKKTIRIRSVRTDISFRKLRKKSAFSKIYGYLLWTGPEIAKENVKPKMVYCI